MISENDIARLFCMYKFILNLKFLRRQGEKFSTKPTTEVKLGTSGRWVETRTGAGVTATLV